MTEFNVNKQFTLLDRAARSIDGKRILPIISVMSKKVSDFLDDIPFIEANRGLQHQLIRDVGMASSTRRRFYGKVVSTHRPSQTSFEPIALLERRSEVDEDHIDTLENPTQERQNQDIGHMEKLGEDLANAFFHDDPADGSEFIHGLEPRLNKLNQTLKNTYDGGGSGGDTTSIYIVEWNTRDGAMGLFPPNWMKNTRFGIAARNKGKERVGDTEATGYYYAYVTQFKAWLGLAVGNERKIARITNLEATIGATNSFESNGDALLIEALNLGRFDKARTRIYMNETMKTQVDIVAQRKSNVNLRIEMAFGKPVETIHGVPLRVVDNTIIINTETVVTA
ncbi:hypothetical protein LCGC14_1072530 [marine sediment metagenome]|uniref:Major capsid protein n=1 Tax=marine sediment metagenome TaxID=412755 RepID=A0A0F9QNN6_9ZZZZ